MPKHILSSHISGGCSMKNALITGITGQDGSYLAEFLLNKGYNVYGLVRRSSSSHFSRLARLQDKVYLLYGDLLDLCSLRQAVGIAAPDEIYHLAAQSNVGESFTQPIATMQYNAVGTLNMLEACFTIIDSVKFYNAATSEMFGNYPTHLHVKYGLNEHSYFHPRSPYGVSKVAAFQMTKNYREAYDLFACNGILFNHESPRRSEQFVTRKITRGVARIALGLQEKLTLGNLTSMRDWGYAPDYVEAMWLMLQQESPDDYVVATGVPHSVNDFVDAAFQYVGIKDWYGRVNVSTEFGRPSDIDYLCGDASKAKQVLGWEPHVSFEELVKIMVEEDLCLSRVEKARKL